MSRERILKRLLKPIHRRIGQILERGNGLMVNPDTKMQTLQIQGKSPNPHDGVEHFEPYGFTSHPKKGYEPIFASLGGRRSHTICLVAADRRFRITGLAEGEVALHDDQGQTITLHRDRIEITTPKLVINAAESQLTGNLQVDGNIIVPNGTVSASGTVLS